ncbi:hypothetical protein PG988_006831 [Apiospora saccharicola]
MLFNLRNGAVALLVALAAMTSGAFAAPVPVASPIIQTNGTDSPNGTVAVRGHKPWPPPYWCEMNGGSPAAINQTVASSPSAKLKLSRTTTTTLSGARPCGRDGAPWDPSMCDPDHVFEDGKQCRGPRPY